MLCIYVVTVGTQFQLFKEILANFTPDSVINAVKLIISCLMHGFVYEETVGQ